MSKSSRKSAQSEFVRHFLKDVELLHSQPTNRKYQELVLPEYPFDHQLLSLSPLYRTSRKLYASLDGVYSQRISSTMRSLSTQDLFKDEIDYTPSFSELIWFKDYHHEIVDPEQEIEALMRFNEISLFHEQNHRVIWRMLPPAPKEKKDLCRYLNFAESLVVTLDLALGDELGPKLSTVFERMKVIYRTGSNRNWKSKSKDEYRRYLLSLLCSTYFVLETVHPEDILKAVNYIFPGQKKMNQDAVKRSQDINELFTNVTNPMWQDRNWKEAGRKLKEIHSGSEESPLYLPEDPLDLEEEFYIAGKIFDYYGL